MRSIAHLEQKLTHLELKEELNSSYLSALQRMKVELNSLDTKFRNYHFVIVDIAEENAQEAEQAVLDEHDDRTADIIARIEDLFTLPKVKPTVPNIDSCSAFHKRMQRVRNNIRLVADEVLPMKSGHKVDDVCLIQQPERQITKFEADLNEISNGVLSADLDEDKELTK